MRTHHHLNFALRPAGVYTPFLSLLCLLYAINSFGDGEEEEAAQCCSCCPWLLLLLYKRAVELYWCWNTFQIYFSFIYRQLQYWILIKELSLCLQPVFFTGLPVVISWHSCWEVQGVPALGWLGLSCWHVFGRRCRVLQSRLWEQRGVWAYFLLCLTFGKLLVPSHSLEGAQRFFLVYSSCVHHR